MNSDTDKPDGQTIGLPFTRPIVRRLTEELFREQSQWKTGSLVERVVQLHRQRGGSAASNPDFTVRRVLQDLKQDGLVSAPGHGWWRLNDAPPEGASIPEEPITNTTTPLEEATDDFERPIRPEKEIGAGTECVYLYFNPNDRELAELKGRDVWECKIGRTNNSNAIPRILGQGVRTALSRPPMIGLVLRTDDSAALENALHSSLRLISAEVPESLGAEWFFTSPARIEAWYAGFQSALAAIRGSSTNTTHPDEQPTVA